MPSLRPLTPADHDALVAVYRDAVLSQTAGLYSAAQVTAWAHHAGRSGALQEPLRDGYGLASLDAQAGVADRAEEGRPMPGGTIEAFGILHPPDRLALLYCRGRSCRQGRSSAILRGLERHAAGQGIAQLRTEASQLSRPLLLRHGWQVEAEERVLFAAVWFVRWRMIKALVHPEARTSRG